jgi:thiosulfate/3-mercaptopyruvate sulfurtransferase
VTSEPAANSALAEPGPLIQPADLAAALTDGESPVLLDVRWALGGPPGIDSYRAGHLPGAVFVDLDTDLAGPHGSGGRHPLPEVAVFGAAMRAAGVQFGQPVVCYDDGDATIAARLWWMLRHHGHDQVRVLDGGYAGWVAAGLPVSTEVPSPVTGDFRAGPGRLPVLDTGDAAVLARTGVLLDARQPERYRGETEPVDPVAGHIPGAISAPTRSNVGPDGRFLAVAALRDRFTRLGLLPGAGPSAVPAHAVFADDPAPAVGVYCGSGVTATHEILALELAGLPGAALYVGSWSQWCADPARPVATGADPG